MLRSPRVAPAQLAGGYALVASAWIVGTDLLARTWSGSAWVHLWVDIARGFLFVLLTSLLLYWLASGMVRRLREAERDRERAEKLEAARLERSNRLYRTLARANEAALGATDRTELLRAICDASIECAGLRLAWIGWVDEDTQRLVIETRSGPAATCTDQLIISVNPAAPESRGPSGRAILEQRGIACQDVATEPLMTPWREQARAHCIGSCAAVPLRDPEGRRGTLSLYAQEPGFFTDDIMQLIGTLAADLAHGLEVIAVRRQLQEQADTLRTSLAITRATFEQAAVGIAHVALDGRFLRLNQRFCEITGYPEEELLRLDFQHITHPEDLSADLHLVGDVLAGRIQTYTLEKRYLRRDGSIVPVSLTVSLARNERDEPDFFISVITDITARRAAEERMELLHSALQAVPAGIVITDRDGRIEWTNDAYTRLTGCTPEETQGLLLHPPGPDDAVATQLWLTVRQGLTWNGESIGRRKDGTTYPERTLIAPVKFHGEHVTHFIAIKEDVTEQKQLEQQLLRSQRMEGIGLLAGGIAHDLNNVLAPILLNVDLLRQQARAPGDQRPLEMIETAARRGSGIVRQVLTFARGIDGERTPLRPRDLIRELLLVIEETFPRNITVRREIDETTPMVLGDTTQLHQVLLNLAVNARDALPEGGQLTFRAAPVRLGEKRLTLAGDLPPGLYARLSVEDTGQGMTPDVRDHIFQPFFTTKPQGKGTGLGLPTVLGIVRSHGGGIEVHSAPGAGSLFHLYLPAVNATAPAEKPGPPAVSTRLAGGGRLVLVCDDERSIREVATILLRRFGFEVVEAAHGREALQIFAARRDEVAAVLMDIMMPVLPGDRAAAEMLAQRPDLPVLLMSGLMEQEVVQAAMRNTGRPKVALLRKPFTLEELTAALSRLLAGQETGRQLGA